MDSFSFRCVARYDMFVLWILICKMRVVTVADVFPSPVRSLVGELFFQLDLSVIRSLLWNPNEDRIVDTISNSLNRTGTDGVSGDDSCRRQELQTKQEGPA
ncbi:hypothetical protein Tco_1002139 [Tanacetum coccineum]|uniref:Uncharacterized protein n=1 Tax=Tanacetum coccineum TaxID=301880 RepID=A0ABQ5F5I0_9ASTR